MPWLSPHLIEWKLIWSGELDTRLGVWNVNKLLVVVLLFTSGCVSASYEQAQRTAVLDAYIEGMRDAQMTPKQKTDSRNAVWDDGYEFGTFMEDLRHE